MKTKLTKKIGLFLSTVLIVLIVAMGKHDVLASTSKTTVIRLVTGDTYKLSIEDNGNKVIWKSLDQKVATVSSTGKIKAIKKGTAIITATVGKSQYAWNVKVTKTGINNAQKIMYLGEETKLSMVGISGKVIWTSSDKKVVKVTKKGVVRSVQVGKATITATVNSKTYVCEINVKKPKLILEQFEDESYAALFSDGFMVNIIKSERISEEYESVFVLMGYSLTNETVQLHTMKETTLTAYNSKATKKYEVIPYAQYSKVLESGEKKWYKDSDLFLLMENEYDDEMNIGLCVFKSKGTLNHVVFYDGMHKCTAYLINN